MYKHLNDAPNRIKKLDYKVLKVFFYIFTWWWSFHLVVPHNQNFGKTRNERQSIDDLEEEFQSIIRQDYSGEAHGFWRNYWQEKWVVYTGLK